MYAARALILRLSLGLFCAGAVCAQETSPSKSEIQVSAEIPKGYEVGGKSMSPNGRFAILYPVRNEENPSDDLPPNLLVCLKPYSLLTRIGGEGGRGQGARGQPLAHWSGNSVVAIWIGRKWGMEDLAIYEIEADQVKQVQAVWQQVRIPFDRDFRERFLAKYPDEKGSGITFVSEDGPDAKPELEFKGRKLVLNLFADNKPNLASGVHWTATLHAIWNMDTAKFDKMDFQPGKIEVRPDQ
jgi:hypothetical protein